MKFKIFYKEIEKSFNKIGGSNQKNIEELKLELDKLKKGHIYLQEEYRKKLIENEKNDSDWEKIYKEMQKSNSDSIERINKKNKESINELKEENNKLKLELDKLKNDHTLLQEENNKSKSELDKLKNDHTLLQEENNKLKFKLDKLDEDHIYLKEEYKKKLEENEKNNLEWEELYQGMQKSNSDSIDRINKNNKKLINELDKLKEENDKLKK